MTRKTTRRNFIMTQRGCGWWEGAVTLKIKPTPLPTGDNAGRCTRRTGIRVPIFQLGGAGQTPSPGMERSVMLWQLSARWNLAFVTDTAASHGPSEDYFKVLPGIINVSSNSKTDVRDRDGAARIGRSSNA